MHKLWLVLSLAAQHRLQRTAAPPFARPPPTIGFVGAILVVARLRPCLPLSPTAEKGVIVFSGNKLYTDFYIMQNCML